MIARRSLVAPKSVAKGGALVRSMGLTAAALEDLETTCRKTFDEFDADKGGSVDTEEIKAMMLSLGMLVKPETIKQMMKEADTDKSGEIEFDEFFAVMKSQAEGSSGGAFGALVNRNVNSGPALQWSTDEKHATPGVCVNKDDTRVVEFSGVSAARWPGSAFPSGNRA